MRKRKGAALPGAIMACGLLLVVSFSVAYLVIHNATLHRLSSIESGYRLDYLSAFNHFKEDNGSLANISSSTFVYTRIVEEDNPNKALIARTKGGQMKFYAIYDFDSNATLAYQTEDFYITVIGEEEYLGGLLPLSKEGGEA